MPAALNPFAAVTPPSTCFQGPSGRRIGAAEMNPSADTAEQTTTLLGAEGMLLIRKARGGSGARDWKSRRDGGGIAAARREAERQWSSEAGWLVAAGRGRWEREREAGRVLIG
uniref:Uncharacterized protein n=1 Tax=Arundo donax TaxID=35708 RepID=A0A0A9GMI4_ARUDO